MARDHSRVLPRGREADLRSVSLEIRLTRGAGMVRCDFGGRLTRALSMGGAVLRSLPAAGLVRCGVISVPHMEARYAAGEGGGPE
jgi:hypothetical protein